MSVSTFRDDSRFQESRLPYPNEAFREQYPVFCFRITLARLTNRFCKLDATDESSSVLTYLGQLEALYTEICSFKDSVPTEWRPDHDIFAEPEEHRAVLLLHIEYHTLVLAVLTSVSATPYMMPHRMVYETDQIRNQTLHKVNNARRMLCTLDTIANNPQLTSNLICWYVGSRHYLS